MQLNLSLDDSPVIWAAAFANVPTIPAQPREKPLRIKRSARVWHDLKLVKKYHQGLVAVVKITNVLTGEYLLHSSLDVRTYLRQLDELLHNGKHHIQRLQELFDYAPDFHVQVIAFAQYKEGDPEEKRDYAWGEGREQALELYQRWIKQVAKDPLFLNAQRQPYPTIPSWLTPQPLSHQAEEISARQFQL